MFIACLLCIITLKEPSLKLLSITLASLFVLSMASEVFDHCISINFKVLHKRVFRAICFDDTENVMAYLAELFSISSENRGEHRRRTCLGNVFADKQLFIRTSIWRSVHAAQRHVSPSNKVLPIERALYRNPWGRCNLVGTWSIIKNTQIHCLCVRMTNFRAKPNHRVCQIKGFELFCFHDISVILWKEGLCIDTDCTNLFDSDSQPLDLLLILMWFWFVCIHQVQCMSVFLNENNLSHCWSLLLKVKV